MDDQRDYAEEAANLAVMREPDTVEQLRANLNEVTRELAAAKSELERSLRYTKTVKENHRAAYLAWQECARENGVLRLRISELESS